VAVSSPFTELLLDLHHAVLEIRELGDGHLVGQDGPPRPELNRLGLSACAELGDPIGRLQAQAGQPADGEVEDVASPLLHLAAYLSR
jgi:hypothetical protein